MKKVLWAMMAMGTLVSCKELKVIDRGERMLQTEQRALTGFERIEQLGSLDVEYQQADSFSVSVEAPADVLPYVVTRVEGNRLIVNMKGQGKVVNFGVKEADDVTVRVTSPDFLGIELKGSGDFDCKGHLDTDNLDIQLRGSGDVEFDDVICDHVSVTLMGSGDVEVKNAVTRQSKVELVGSGDIKARLRQARQTDIDLKGSGDITLNLEACGAVRARLVGSGDITLRGDVDALNQQARGSGSIQTKGLRVKN